MIEFKNTTVKNNKVKCEITMPVYLMRYFGLQLDIEQIKKFKGDFEPKDFSFELADNRIGKYLDSTIAYLNECHKDYICSNSPKDLEKLIAALPCAYTQTLMYETTIEELAKIYNTKRFHGFAEWKPFAEWFESII